ncbi:MAG: mechanosensitive ion channel family protein [Candidatus Kariarchaeaceae archaeon]|jgi:small-conductance mechanosensitive channel
MTFIDDVVAFLEGFEFGGNSGYDYALALGVFLLSILVLQIFKYLIIGRLKHFLVKKDRSKTAQQLLDRLNKTISFTLILFISLMNGVMVIETPSLLDQVIRVIVYLLLSYALLKLLFVIVDAFLLNSKVGKSLSSNLIEFLRLFFKTIIVVIVLLWFLSNLGIDTTAFLASFGVFGLAIAFALQNVISDIFAALIIYIDRPFEIGDYIQIGSDIGEVEKVGIRSTKIRVLAGNLLIVSNRELISTRIFNHKKMEKRRVPMTIGVHCSTPIEKLREIPKWLESIVTGIEGVTFDRAFFTAINDYSYDFEMVYFVMSRSYSEYLKIRQEINFKIVEVLEANEIIIPYPTSTVELEGQTSVGA